MAEILSTERAEAGPPVDERHIPYEADGGVAERAAVGVIVLATDQTIEYELRRVFTLPGVGLYESRIFNPTDITPDGLRAMQADIATAAGLILPGLPLHAIGYGCTSGALAIGEARVAELVRQVRPGIPCTSPMQAALVALEALGLRRLAMLTPYVEEINRTMRDYIEADGVAVPVMGSFNEVNDHKVGRISPESVAQAALRLGRSDLVEGVFIACSSLRVLEITPRLEAELGKPVFSSNTAMAWHCLRLAGIDDPQPDLGRLYTCPLPPA